MRERERERAGGGGREKSRQVCVCRRKNDDVSHFDSAPKRGLFVPDSKTGNSKLQFFHPPHFSSITVVTVAVHTRRLSAQLIKRFIKSGFVD